MTGYIRYVLMLGFIVTGCSKSKTEKDELAGSVAIGGESLKNVTLVAANPAGEEASALTDAEGHFRMPNPPKGELKFKITGFAPPPPPPVPGEPVIVAPTDKAVPARYHTTNNELQFDYKGGQQTYDIQLKR